MSTEIASAYVSIIPSMKGMGKGIASQLGGLSGLGKKVGGQLGGFIGDGIEAGGRRGASGLGSALKSAAGMAAAAFATIGLGRLVDEAAAATDATQKFKSTLDFAGLGTAEIDALTKSTRAYADATVYELGDIQNITAQLAANGVADYDRLAEAAGNLNAVAGGNAETFKSVGMVMTQTAGAGKLTTENWNQLADAIPGASGKLQEAMRQNGAYTGNFREAMEKGEISAEEFNAAIMQLGFEDAAVNAAKSTSTFEGAIGNLKAAAVGGLSDILAQLQPAITGCINAAADAVTGVSAIISERMAAGIGAFTSSLDATGSPLQAFKAALDAAFDGTPIGSLISWLSGCVSLFQTGKTPVDGFKLVLENLKNTIAGITSGGGLQSFLSSLPQPIQGVIAKIQELASSPLGSFLSDMASKVGVFGGAFALFLAKFGAPLSSAAAGVGQFVSKMGGIGGVIGKVGGAFKGFGATVSLMGESLAASVAGGGFAGFLGFFKGMPGLLMGAINPVTLVVGGIAALVAAFASMMATNEGFRASVMGVVSSIGASLAPVLATIGAALQQLAAAVLPVVMQLISSLVPVLAQIVMVVLQVAAALAPVIATIVGLVVPILTQIVTMVVQVASAIVAAVLPVITAILSAIQAAMPTIQAIFTAACTAIQTVVNTVWPIIQTVITTVMNVIMGVISAVMAAINGDWSGVWSAIQSVASSVWSGIQSVISAAIGAVQGVISSVLSGIKSLWSGAWSSVKSIVSSAWDGIKSAVSGGIEGMMGFISSIPGRIRGFFADAGSWLISSGQSIIDGLVSGIQGAIGGAISAVSGAVQSIRDLFPFSPAKVGPFSGRGWVLYSGMSIADAMAEGFERRTPAMVGAYRSGMSALNSALTPDSATPRGNAQADRVEALLSEILYAIPDMNDRAAGRWVRAHA